MTHKILIIIDYDATFKTLRPARIPESSQVLDFPKSMTAPVSFSHQLQSAETIFSHLAHCQPLLANVRTVDRCGGAREVRLRVVQG
ncbi:hypothetical protein ACJ73_07303 [Blastomyces percursus]|uniref:Uncharacterized protein n=1 Tax=Blastomyces percursus TaxID=1658174 RepID=A0A1J9PYG4_9EURO|nr:hypothetical protein ACJ73_07303 [Blastomyces percursus]